MQSNNLRRFGATVLHPHLLPALAIGILQSCSAAGWEGYGPKGGGLVGSAHGYTDERLSEDRFAVTYSTTHSSDAIRGAARRAAELCAGEGYFASDFDPQVVKSQVGYDATGIAKCGNPNEGKGANSFAAQPIDNGSNNSSASSAQISSQNNELPTKQEFSTFAALGSLVGAGAFLAKGDLDSARALVDVAEEFSEQAEAYSGSNLGSSSGSGFGSSSSFGSNSSSGSNSNFGDQSGGQFSFTDSSFNDGLNSGSNRERSSQVDTGPQTSIGNANSSDSSKYFSVTGINDNRCLSVIGARKLSTEALNKGFTTDYYLIFDNQCGTDICAVSKSTSSRTKARYLAKNPASELYFDLQDVKTIRTTQSIEKRVPNWVSVVSTKGLEVTGRGGTPSNSISLYSTENFSFNELIAYSKRISTFRACDRS